MSLDVFPDAEAIVRTGLADALACGVYSSVPKSPSYPLVTVQRVGGLPAERHRLDSARIQIDVWGTSKSEAQDIAQQARTAVHQMEGSGFTDPVTGFITGVEDSLGLAFLPDPETARDRYTFGLTVHLHA